jgi:hypothetical protein
LLNTLIKNGPAYINSMKCLITDALLDNFEPYFKLFAFLSKSFPVEDCLDDLFKKGPTYPDLWPRFHRFINSDMPNEVTHKTVINYLQNDNPSQKAFAAAMAGPTSIDFNSSFFTPNQGMAGSNEVMEALLPLLEDSNFEVRRYGAIAVGSAGDRRAVETLITLLTDETELNDPYCSASTIEEGIYKMVSCIAALLLGVLEDYRAFNPLIECLSGTNVSLRLAAVQALENFHDVAIVPHLISTFNQNTYEQEVADGHSFSINSPKITKNNEIIVDEIDIDLMLRQSAENWSSPKAREARLNKAIQEKILTVLETFDDEEAREFIKSHKNERRKNNERFL